MDEQKNINITFKHERNVFHEVIIFTLKALILVSLIKFTFLTNFTEYFSFLNEMF